MPRKSTIGNYRVLEQIGEGAFARTYKAEHILLGELACLKQNLDVSEEDEALLRAEAKLLWHIHHHSLPTLRDYIRHTDDSHILVMTYIRGKDLYKVVEKDYPRGIPAEHVCWITQRLLNALQYLHFHGVIHSDVKPQNILIQPDEHNAVLVDYGLSTLSPGRRTKPKGFTPAFAPPELLAGKPPIPESDIFSLGVSMIHALGGDFVGKTYPRGVPKEIQEFFNQMILHDQMARPHTAGELVESLSDLRFKLFGRRASGTTLKIS